MTAPLNLRLLFLSAAAACALSACGGGGSDDAPSPPPTPSPPDVSPTCKSLTSGTYRVIVPAMASAGQYSTDTLTLNAATGVTTGTDPSDVGQLTGTGNCTFDTDGGGQAVVSSAGVLVFRSVEAGGTRLGLAFPEQTIAVADLAGNWRKLGFERTDSGTYAADFGEATIAANGAFTVTRYCPDVKTCLASIPAMSISLSPNAAGGYDLVNTTQSWTDRVFAYRSGTGELMMASLAGNGSVSLWTQQRTNSLPAVGTRSTTWGVYTNASLVSPAAPSLSDFTTTAVDAAAGSSTRVSEIDGHPETISINMPYPGLNFRAEGTAVATKGPNAGSNVTVREFASLGLRGMGISVLSLPSLSGGSYFLSVSVSVAAP